MSLSLIHVLNLLRADIRTPSLTRLFPFVSLQVGTSSVVYPAAMFAPQVAARGVAVAEFNMESTPATERFKHVSFTVFFYYYFF